MPPDDAKLIDPRTEVSLTSSGLLGFTVAETIDRHGERQMWIVDRQQLDTAAGRDIDHGNEHPDHDETGPLPAEWQRRLAASPIRCGRPCVDGHACQIPVSRPGHVCGWHRKRVIA